MCVLICSDKSYLHFGVIVCMLGTRYKSYCSNIVRTLMVEPTPEVQKNYDFLLQIEDVLINKLQHGRIQNGGARLVHKLELFGFKMADT